MGCCQEALRGRWEERQQGVGRGNVTAAGGGGSQGDGAATAVAENESHALSNVSEGNDRAAMACRAALLALCGERGSAASRRTCCPAGVG